ncbi:undecaprenyl-diphosphate phosphatase [Pararhizobium mangrovi]|uniref:Undecaprenyl-diphosphatase n=1 Tax=Pararhizobium mangrovi TaxID=2590452 RepID=A0A506U3G8_9HYPH|nr:undecaprenyl-diphosphate phosphatase [Pararhizobium mangrovi]TPW28380.1 undecaprenyl-diphosphate phosphatase [Pararhizobium mangrovi]
MADHMIFSSLVLGLLEGLTEFIPVSSTGHLLLAERVIGFSSPGDTFEVLIQLGAIAAIVTVYFARLVSLAKGFFTDSRRRHFVIAIVVAFLPAAVIGAIAHDFIKQVLFESPRTICIALILGGIVLLVVDRMNLKPRYHDVVDYPIWLALAIGFFQCLAMIPGTSRSGSTIVGALLLGADKRSAAEFSFFLAMPTMAGAFAFDLYKNIGVLNVDATTNIVIGFVAAFVAGIFVVRTLLDFVSRHGYAPFAYWRLVVGIVGLVLLTFG